MDLNLLQLTSSLPSAHSATPEHIKWPGIHVKSLHWNWSSRHVLFWQFCRLSSSPEGQSIPPSQSHCLSIQVILSLHKKSVAGQIDIEMCCVWVQFCVQGGLRKWQCLIMCFGHLKSAKRKLAYVFVGGISTIRIIITTPFLCDARSIATSKVIFFTFLLWTV